MSTDTRNIVNKAWNFAHVLRDDGRSYMAYTEQITLLETIIDPAATECHILPRMAQNARKAQESRKMAQELSSRRSLK